MIIDIVEMHRDRNIPNLEDTGVEQDDITIWLNIIAKQIEICFICVVIILALFSILFIYYNFNIAFAIVKWSFYLCSIYLIIQYIKFKYINFKYINFNWKKYIQSIENYAVFAPFGKPTLDSDSDYASDYESDCESDCESERIIDCNNDKLD